MAKVVRIAFNCLMRCHNWGSWNPADPLTKLVCKLSLQKKSFDSFASWVPFDIYLSHTLCNRLEDCRLLFVYLQYGGACLRNFQRLFELAAKLFRLQRFKCLNSVFLKSSTFAYVTKISGNSRENQLVFFSHSSLRNDFQFLILVLKHKIERKTQDYQKVPTRAE